MKHYLVIQLARFGDLLQTKRLIATLQARGDGEVHLCLDRSLASLARLVYPQAIIHSIVAHGTGLTSAEASLHILQDNRAVFSSLSALQFDEVYNLNLSPLNFRLAALFSPEHIRGHGWHNGQEVSSLWAQMAMQWAKRRHIAINLVDFWAYYCRDAIAPDAVNPVAKANGELLGVVLAGRESRRSVPLELLTQYVTALARLNKETKVVLLGSHSERSAGKNMLRSLPDDVASRTENLAGKTSWEDLFDLVGSMKQILTPDTGTMHLAAHLGTPVVAFFLSSAWCFETGPYGLGHSIYQATRECLPCLEVTPCPFDVRCRTGFEHTDFIRFMITGKEGLVPEGMTAYTTEFDDFGVVNRCFAGVDNHEMRRLDFREFLRQHLGKASKGIPQHDWAVELYREKDWMLPASPEGPEAILADYASCVRSGMEEKS